MDDEKSISIDKLLEVYNDLSLNIAGSRFRRFANHLKKIDLTLNQFSILSNILRNGACSSNQLAQYLKLKAASITYLVDALEKKGLVTRIQNPEDGRSHLVHLTDAGIDAANYRVDNTDMTTFFEQLSQDDQELIYVAMQVLNRKLPSDS